MATRVHGLSLAERWWSKEYFQEVDRCVIVKDSVLIPRVRHIYLTAHGAVTAATFGADIRLHVGNDTVVPRRDRTRRSHWQRSYARWIRSVTRSLIADRNRTASLHSTVEINKN